MKNEQIKKVLLVLIALGILGAFAYYARTNETKDALKDESSDIATDSEGNSIEDATAEESSASSVEVKDPVINSDSDEKISSLVESGNKAFYAKDYDVAIKYYNEALSIRDSDFIYARLHSAYSAKGDTPQAVKSIDTAINKSPLFTEYWVTKLVYLDDKTNTSFSEIKNIYMDGLTKVDSRTKPNLVTIFARIAESNGMPEEAISAWQKAIEIYPKNKAIYQAEIDRLK